MNYILTSKTRKLYLTVIFALFLLPVLGKESSSLSYAELDNEIVKAYNSIPRDNLKVYGNSIEILSKAENDNTAAGKAWKLKAQKLITISCFYECTQAIDRKLYRDAYIWAIRGTGKGTDKGKVGDVSLKSLYNYLKFAGSELKKTPVVKNSDQNKLIWQIDNFQNSAADNKVKTVIYNGKSLKHRLTKELYSLIEGPAINEEIFVKITAVNKDYI